MNVFINVTKLVGRNRWAVRRIDSHKGRDSVVGYFERKFANKFSYLQPYVYKQNTDGYGYIGGLTMGELRELSEFIASLGE
jgi:hypothetical protein